MKKKSDKSIGRQVIFLEIAGVPQPGGRQDRFNHDLDQLREDLAANYNNDEYLEMDTYDLGAVWVDWGEASDVQYSL